MMSDSHDALYPPPHTSHDVGDSLEIIISDGPDGEPIVDSVLRDRSGVAEAVRNSRDAAT